MAGNVYGGYLMQIPGIQSVYQAYLQVFSTTRNGLFFGVMFIAMGALFAQRTLYLKNWQVLLGFLLSAGLLFAECFALKDNGFMHDLTSMYAMLLPCMFFLFLGLLRIHLPHSKVYKTLRVLSLLIYVMHIMFVNLLLRVWPLMNSLAVYGLVMLLTLIMSCFIIICSRKVKFLKHLYA